MSKQLTALVGALVVLGLVSVADARPKQVVVNNTNSPTITVPSVQPDPSGAPKARVKSDTSVWGDDAYVTLTATVGKKPVDIDASAAVEPNSTSPAAPSVAPAKPATPPTSNDVTVEPKK